jgi:putative zinc finger/helix-turn-helix YgiT family protein
MSDESKNNSSKDICPTCRNAKIRRVTRDYKVNLPDGQTSTVANLSFEECPECKDEFFSSEAMDRISDKVSAELDSLSSSDLKRIREKLQPNMTLLAESLGLGSKTWMRWENGEQNISRSMGYFIRTLSQFPEVYEWVADRGWRQDEAEEQATTQEHSSAISELFSKVMQNYLSVKSGETLSEDEKEESGSFVNEMFNRTSSVSKKSRINLRRGDIQDSDSRFKGADSRFNDFDASFKDFAEAS